MNSPPTSPDPREVTDFILQYDFTLFQSSCFPLVISPSDQICGDVVPRSESSCCALDAKTGVWARNATARDESGSLKVRELAGVSRACFISKENFRGTYVEFLPFFRLFRISLQSTLMSINNAQRRYRTGNWFPARNFVVMPKDWAFHAPRYRVPHK